MATETIKEFLVALGYKQDEAALKKFEDGINKATKAVFSLAAAIETTAVLVAAGVARFASNLEALYFAAQRTGSSATQLKALDLAARNLGANAGDAQAAVEGLASALRINPGNVGMLTGLLARLGLTSQKNADGSINAGDALLKLSQVFRTMPFFQAAQFAQQLGISEQTLYQLTRGNLVEEYRKTLAELGPGGFDQASEHAHQFMVDLRDLQAQFEVFGVQVGDAIQQKLGISLKDIKHWMEVNGPWLAGRVADIALTLIQAAQWIGEKVEWLVGKLKEWDEETDGLSTKLLALGLILKVTGAGSIVGGVLSLAGAFVRLAAAMVGVNAAGATGALARLLGPVGAGIGAGWALDKYFPDNPLAKLGGWLGNKLFDSQHRAEDYQRALRDMGWSPAAATGIVANFARESHLDPDATGDNGTSFGLGQWHDPSRLLDFKRLFGHDLSQSTDMEQLRFTDWELRNHPEYGGNMLRAAQNSEMAARAFSSYFERPANSAAEAERRAAIAGNISQQNTFHIASSDPHAAASQIDARLRQINADLTRSFALLTS